MKENDAIKTITNSVVARWKYLLGIEEWKIKFRYTKLEDGGMGECRADPVYRKATIVFDLAEHKDKKDLLDTLRHEMLHIVHAEFEHFRDQAREYFSPAVATTLDDVYMIGAEACVRKLEGLLDRLEINLKGKQE